MLLNILIVSCSKFHTSRRLIFITELQETSTQLFAALELTFSIDLSPEEGGGIINNSVELVSRGRDLEVNASNVYTYVRKYSQYR